jgi:hypothetical protein
VLPLTATHLHHTSTANHEHVAGWARGWELVRHDTHVHAGCARGPGRCAGGLFSSAQTVYTVRKAALADSCTTTARLKVDAAAPKTAGPSRLRGR